MRLLIGISLVLLSTQVFPASWSCRNQDLEIHCDSGRCEVADGFTPLDIQINTDGALSVCAYSGCWEGKGEVMESGHHILVSGTNLKWTGSDANMADFMLAVDSSDNIGFVKGAGFAMPVNCMERSKP